MNPFGDRWADRSVSLIIPIYNEAPHLRRFLEKVDALDLGIKKELVFIDDCSKDESRAILQSFPFQSQKQILLQEVNQGKGAALHRGFQAARGSYVLVQDADFEYDMADIPSLLEPLLADRADIVYGSRFRKDVRQVHRTFHYLVNRLLTLWSNLLSGLYLTDMETCYKVFRAEIIQNIRLESKRFGFEPEITAKVARLNVRIQEAPVSYYPRNYLEGKKITWKDGIAALWHITRFNLWAKQESFFTEQMPKAFLLSGRKWL